MRYALIVCACCAVTLQAVSYAAFEQLTVATSSVGFTSSKISPNGLPEATRAYCRLETAEIRFTTDGTVPTTLIGTILSISDILEVNGHDQLMQFRAIRTGGSSGVLDCTYTAP